MTTPIGIKIKELRTLAGLSQEELGGRVGVQRAAIQKYEKGTIENIPIKTIERLAEIFDVSPMYLVGWNDQHTNPLAVEVRLLQGVKNVYGVEYVDLLESYTLLNPEGRLKLIDYADDMLKIYQLDDHPVGRCEQ